VTALWLEAYNPGEPLNFLDHHIKCGDAIVGLAHRSELEKGIADEAFKTLAVDDKDIAKTWRDKNVKERKERIAKSLQLKAEFEKSTYNSVQESMAEYKTFNQLPETTPDEIERKAKAYKKFIDGKGFTFLKAMADTQVAQFFIPKTEANAAYLMTDADFRLILSGYKGWQNGKVAKATAVALDQRVFHWFIEFPEVFNEGGFNCILGNPPYLGGKKISGSLGDAYLNFLYANNEATGGLTDLVVYFLRRDSSVVAIRGFISIITTNSICQGDTRESGLEYLIRKGYKINFAIKSMKWPGQANLEVSLFSVAKNNALQLSFNLNGSSVHNITSFFDDQAFDFLPLRLMNNTNKSYVGTIVSGKGFVLSKDEAQTLLQDKKNKDVVFPYFGGDDLLNEVNVSATRYVINFHDWNIEKAMSYEKCFRIIENLVKPERAKVKKEVYKNKWWLYAERQANLYDAIVNKNEVIGVAQTSKHLSFVRIKTNQVISFGVAVITNDSYSIFSFLQSSIHFYWTQKNTSTLETRLRYTPSDCFETFPFPQNLIPQQEQQLETFGEAYHEHRRQLMLGMQLGLTKTYNLFHSNAITAQSINFKDKQVASLQKHLDKTANTISFDEAIQGILKLRELHVQMDEVVLDAYGWNDIELKHDFYEVDYLPENDRVRFTIHPEARKEVLKRLLELNHKIHEEEVKAGLWEKKKTLSKKSNKVSEPQTEYVSNLFNQGN